MKVLLIEDSPSIQETYTIILEQKFNAKVQIAKNYAEAVDIIDDGIDEISLIVCDHNFPDFEGESPQGLGQDILFEVIQTGYTGYFLHFSSEPCPEKYDLKDKVKFTSINKGSITCIKQFIEYVNSL